MYWCMFILAATEVGTKAQADKFFVLNTAKNVYGSFKLWTEPQYTIGH